VTSWRELQAPVLAAASGFALLVAHPPLGWWPATFLTAPLLLGALTVDERAAADHGRGVRALRLGMIAGVAAYAPMLSWLILPAGVVGWSLLVLVQAAWLGVAAWAIRPVLQRPLLLPAVAAAAWAGMDAWRSVLPLNGFEWGAIAYAHVDGSWLLPLARIAGGRGITLIVVLASAAAFGALERTWSALRERGDAPVETVLGGARGPAAVLVGSLLVSVLATIEPPPETGHLDVLVVQGNEVRHWEVADNPDPPLRIATALRDLTVAEVAAGGRPDVTIWPESSIDRDPSAQRGAPLRELADEAAAAAGVLLSGATLDGPEPASNRRVAGLLLEDGFDETDRYVKRRLVPFGEYIPMRSWLDWFPPLEQIPRDALAGEVPQAVELIDGVRAAVVICFETLFADIVRSNLLADGAPGQLIVTITNDASFGISAEPAQHLAQSRLRAVETGRWVVHGALTGSSAFVDPHGRTYGDTPLFELATIRRDVPLVDGYTPYLRVGDVVGWLTRALLLALVAFRVLMWVRRPSVATRRPDDLEAGR